MKVEAVLAMEKVEAGFGKSNFLAIFRLLLLLIGKRGFLGFKKLPN